MHTHYLAGALVSALEARAEFPRISRVSGRLVIEYGQRNGHELPPAMVDVEAQLADMDSAGIDLAVLSTIAPGVDWFRASDGVAVARRVNDELAELSQAYADRLAALAVLPMQAPDAAAAELERAAGLGLKGAVVFSNIAGRDLDAANSADVLDVAARLGLPIMIHPTYPLSASATNVYALLRTVGFLVDTTVATLRLILGGLFMRHPDFKLYLCHAGSLLPQLVGRIDYEGSRFPGGTGQLDVKPSEEIAKIYTDSVCAWPVALRSAIELVGSERVMFGSDYPFWKPRVTLDTIAEARLEPRVLHALQSDNAAGLFQLG